jgi:two-component system, cell cycle sensor histidine kinase and response regulator CckA
MSEKKPFDKAGDAPDIQAQAQMQSQSQKLEALGQLAGGIAHDFNNILSIIEGYTEIAIKQLAAGTLTADQLDRIRLSTARGAGLTRQLLAFGRQKIGIVDHMDIADSLRKNAVLLQPLFGERVDLQLTVPDQPLWVEAGDDHITQVLLNLALNARDALPMGGTVQVSCMRCGAGSLPIAVQARAGAQSFVRLSVVDNGTGISPAVMPRVFEPFFSTKPRGQGTGMGLSVVYGIVDQLGGAIDIRTHPGDGTAVHVYLPEAIPARATAGGMEADILPSLRGRTILLAEDEPELRDVLALMLEGFEMKVITASNGNHAMELQKIFKGDIDFLLTDVVMPEMDGVELAEIFAARRPATNVVYMSGYPFLSDGRSLNVPDTASFISKPLQEDTVRQVLERALQRRDARQLRGEDTDSD